MQSSLRCQRAVVVEWPTVALALSIYGAWAALTFFHAALPLWLLVPLGAWVVAWHGSLQHEIIHGHPTRWRRVNTALAFPPLSLWLPYERYRRTHLAHHRDERLTDPLDDPESFYWTPEAWQRLGPLGRAAVRLQGTLLGRLILGPAWCIGRFLLAEARLVIAGSGDARRLWLHHAIGVAGILAWLVLVCGIDPLLYVAAFVYPATSLLLIRSFAEHRAAAEPAKRTAIVERSGPLGLLFLFNNLHAAHHARPALPWYELPGWYRANRDRLVAANGGLVYRSYVDVLRRFLLRPHDAPVHPFGRVRPNVLRPVDLEAQPSSSR
ncbi:fatty acid desaturase [Benzoatithermus flavus]|uniref:Fatty acid desaturase n=1 Tax=Benzoatithermus flavus TaxID=3108223 RepID=A0ABU8XX92_9PROT